MHRKFKYCLGFFSLIYCLGMQASDAWAKDPIVTTLVAQSGQVIVSEKISTTTGPCIIIPENVKNVRIQSNQIGPCGSTVDDVGIRIDKGAHHVFIAANIIHDVSTGIYAKHANHPVIIDRNTVYDVRGPLPMGQMVKFDGVAENGFKSRIFGNISDKNKSQNKTAYEDHISIVNSYGSEKNPILIACNKIRGGDLSTGSGITVGKNGGKWFSIRDNIIVLTPNTGIAIAGAERVRVLRNIIWNRGSDMDSQTDHALSIFTDGGNVPKNIYIANNTAIANSWITNRDGSIGRGLYQDNTALNINYLANSWRNTRLKEYVWDISRNDCQ